MSHLHVPDGVLPAWLWASSWGLAILLLLLVTAEWRRRPEPQRVAYQAALGALMLAVMAVEIPLGPLEFHLTLAGPVGVLLGGAGAFQVVFVASAMLAFVGHGGMTVIGLNALVLGAGASLARPLFRALVRGTSPAVAMALSTAVSQAVSGLLWLAVIAVALGASADAGAGVHPHRGWVAGIAIPLLAIGIGAEAGVAFGLARFISRVRPDLLPLDEPRARSAVRGGGLT